VKIARYATWIALGIGAATFLAAYYLLSSTGWSLPIAIGIAAAVCLCSAFAAWLLLDRRSEQEVRFESYLDEAEQKVKLVQQKLQLLHMLAAKVRQRDTSLLLDQLCYDVEQLITRVRTRNANELLSSAEVIDNYIKQVVAVTEKYKDIEAYPRYYKDPSNKLAQIQQGLRSFNEYIVASTIAVEESDTFARDVDVQMLDASRYRRLS
jgi:hypothetical protein